MTATSLVSVVMPILDVAPFLAEAIESVRRQSYPHWELIIVDDGSSDGSTEIARQLAARDPARIRWVEHEGHRNLGASASRNVGLGLAGGEYIALLDGDDVWLPHKLAEQVALLEASPGADLVCGSTEFWHSWTGRPEDASRDHVVPIGVPDGTLLVAPSMLVRMLRSQVVVPCTCSLLMRRAVVERTGGFEESFRRVYTDQAFYAKLFLVGSVLVSESCCDRYRIHPASSCATAERTGEIGTARWQYLCWLRDHVAARHAGGAGVAAAVRRAMWNVRHPRAAAAAVRARRLARRSYAALYARAAMLVPPRGRAAS